MKKILFLSILAVSFAAVSIAQSIELTPLGGYTFADKFKFNGGEAELGGGFTYGGIISFFSGNNALELTYSRQSATANAHSYDNYIDVSDAPVSVNYIFAGGSRHFPVSDEAALFAGLNMGVGFISNDEYRSETRFSTGFNGGVRYFFSDRIGLRLQANLNIPVTDLGSAFWWNPGADESYGVTTYVPILQFGFNGGIIIKLK
jgi:hypothetical protein